MTRLTSFLMSQPITTRLFQLLLLFVVLAGVASAQQVQAASGPAPLITQPIDEGNLVELKGNLYPAASPAADRGPADNNLRLDRMILLFKRSKAQESALAKFVDDQKNPRSADYHKWLTPEQFGARFGSAAQDVATVYGWLRSHGFSIESVSKGRNLLVFSGTNAQLQAAFHTAIHKYQVNGATHYANAANPRIPAALAPAVGGIVKLNDFLSQPQHVDFGLVTKKSGGAKWQPVNSTATPMFNTTISGTDFFAVSPYDFATIYNVKPLWDAGIDGSGQTIAIVGRSDINPADIDAFRAYFGLGLPAQRLNIIYAGPKPEMLAGDEGESALDVEWAGAVAKNATIDFVTARSTNTTDGVQLAAVYAVDNNLAPVMSVSYGLCELGLGTAGNQFFNELWRQAAAQGITVVVSSGDAGSAACDQGGWTANFGLTVNGLSSTPYNISVGGTDLYGTYLDSASYWNWENDYTTQQSVISYMPELPWNNTCGNPQVLAAFQALGSTNATTTEDFCNDWSSWNLRKPVGGGGGASNCVASSYSDATTCSGGYDRPAWQSGVPGVPKGSTRDVPDVSLFAGNGLWGSFYVYCQSDSTPDGKCDFNSGSDVQFLAAGGTSFAAPAFAGIMSLVNQKTNSSQGIAAYELYKLATDQFNGTNASDCDSSVATSGNACQFYDISQGSNAVPCNRGSIDCTLADPNHYVGVLPGFSANVGYDLTVGLGTVNAYNLVNAWSTAAASFTPTQTTLALDSPTVTYGSAITGSITVAAAGGASGTPGGDTSLATVPGSSGVGLGPFALQSGSAAVSGTGVLVGTYSVMAHYAGDATFAASSSNPTQLTITQAATSSTLGASRSAIVAGESVTFDMTISTASLASSPTGTVTFRDATTGSTLGAATVQAATDANGYSIGRASLNVPGRSLNQGSNNITASFAGDGNYTGSAAAAVTVSYTPPFSLSLNPTPILVRAGSSAPASITLTVNGAPLVAAVVLSCPQPMPAGLSCSFSPATVAAGSSTTTSTLTLNAVFPSVGATQKQGTLRRRGRTEMFGVGGAAIFGALALFVLPGRRRRMRVYLPMALLILALIIVAGGCGGSTSVAPAATTTTVSVNPSSAPRGNSFTFTASVAGQGGSGAPTGTVTFSDTNSILGSANVTNGSASLSTNSMALGSHSVVATYGGDTHFLPSSSSSPATAHVQYQTTLTVSASDALGNTTTVQVPVTVE